MTEGDFAHLYAGLDVAPDRWIELACREAAESVAAGGGPFGAVVVRCSCADDAELEHWTGRNQVTASCDPTAHAEIVAIRAACAALGVHDLGRIGTGADASYCVIYSSCEPCPMCYAAIRWARLARLTFAATRFDAGAPGIDFSDRAIYEEMVQRYSDRAFPVRRAATPLAAAPFELWRNSANRRY